MMRPAFRIGLSFALLLPVVGGPLVAQQHGEGDEHHTLQRHKVALFVGYTWVPKGDPHERRL